MYFILEGGGYHHLDFIYNHNQNLERRDILCLSVTPIFREVDVNDFRSKEFAKRYYICT